MEEESHKELAKVHCNPWPATLHKVCAPEAVIPFISIFSGFVVVDKDHSL